MDKISRDCSSMVILGICCILASIPLFDGLYGGGYYTNIDTFAIVYPLVGGNYVATLFGGFLLPSFLFVIGGVLIWCIFD